MNATVSMCHKYVCDIVITSKIPEKITANYNSFEEMNAIKGL